MAVNEEKKHNLVLGIFNAEAPAEEAVEQLKARQFPKSDISVVLPHEDSHKHLPQERSSESSEAAATGATTGAALGGGLGWLLGTGAIVIPGAGAILAAGPLVSALVGAASGGAVGGVSGALIGRGLPEPEAKRYAGMIENGQVLLAVHSDDAAKLQIAERILFQAGAREITRSLDDRYSVPFSQKGSPNERDSLSP